MNEDYCLCHYYDGNHLPFMSLSELNDEDAVALMTSLYSEETEYGRRFKDPLQYLYLRRATETWVRSQFSRKGYAPAERYPVYFVFGRSPWMEAQKPKNTRFAVAEIPLRCFTDDDVSFTYPDSMVSRWLSEEKPKDLYIPDLHGRIFSRTEIVEIVRERGRLEDVIGSNNPGNIAPYIEAQVWNRAPLNDHLKNKNE